MKKKKSSNTIKEVEGWEEAMSLCSKFNIKVYPVWKSVRGQPEAWRIEVDNNGDIKTSKKVLSIQKILEPKDYDFQLKSTLVFLSDKLKNAKNEKV